MPHPGSPYSSQWRNTKYPDCPSVFNPVQSLLPRLHEISRPSCTSLTPSPQRTSPRLTPQICPFQLRWNTSTSLGLTFFPQIFHGQEHPHPQYPLLDPGPCRSWEHKDNFTVWRAPRIYKLLKGNLKSPMTQQALVPSEYPSPAKKPFCWVPCHQRHHKTTHSMGHSKQYNRLFGINTCFIYLYIYI